MIVLRAPVLNLVRLAFLLRLPIVLGLHRCHQSLLDVPSSLGVNQLHLLLVLGNSGAVAGL
jgi:hypothetical protein